MMLLSIPASFLAEYISTLAVWVIEFLVSAEAGGLVCFCDRACA